MSESRLTFKETLHSVEKTFLVLNPKKAFSNYLNTKKLLPVAVNNPEKGGKIILASGQQQWDITNKHSLISLKPFAIAVNAASIPQNFHDSPEIIFSTEEKKELGRMRLHFSRVQHSQNIELKIYHADIPEKPFPFLSRYWTMLLLQLKNSTNKKSKNFIVPPAELLKLFVYSLIPRPVYVISILHGAGFDAFPIDIVGTISARVMIFSIRKSSASVQQILTTRKFCASKIPFKERGKMYELGKYHAGGILPEHFSSLFSGLSQQQNIPLPDFAVDVLELELIESFEEGVHVQLVVKVINEYTMYKVPVLAHTPWFNPEYFKN